MSTVDPVVRPDRNLALELVRVTEAGALASAGLIGRGDKEGADQAAVDAMRHVLDGVGDGAEPRSQDDSDHRLNPIGSSWARVWVSGPR